MVRALVLGGASCVWDDIDAALDFGEYDMVCACNDIGAHWPGRLDHWVSLHPDRLPKWEHERKQRGYLGGYTTWAHRKVINAQKWTSDWAGSSGLLAVKVALEQGAMRVVLAGVPVAAENGHFVRKAAWTSAHGFKAGWRRNMAALGNVRSMSGWTREELGAPDSEWLKSHR